MTEAKLLIEELENAALGFPNTGNFKRCQDAKEKLAAYIEAMKTDFTAGVHEGKAQVQAEVAEVNRDAALFRGFLRAAIKNSDVFEGKLDAAYRKYLVDHEGNELAATEDILRTVFEEALQAGDGNG